MASDVTKRPEISTTPPLRKLNLEKFVESRASELEALHSIVSNGLNGDFRSRRSKRRRTTSYNKRSSKRRKLGADSKRDALDLGKGKEEKVSRKVRRRIELRMNPEEGFSASGDGTKRLRSHVWHAKRFTMTKLWGFHLPLCVQGRGKSSRALLKRFRNGVLVHDASYYATVQLEGPEASLISILKLVMLPSLTSHSQDIYNSIISGVIYGSAMLHHVGAPVSAPIAPVNYMWRPCCLPNRDSDAMDHTDDASNKPGGAESCSTSRQIWVWLHPSGLSEGYSALKLASEREMDERGVSINCSLLDGQLAKLEVMGSKAFQLLRNVLHPISCTSENPSQLEKHSVAESESNPQFRTFSLFDDKECIPSCRVTSLHVKDPRMLHEERIDAPESASIYKLDDLAVTESKDCATIVGMSDRNEVLPPSISTGMEGNETHCSNNELWDASCRVSIPVEDSVLCMERHHMRMNRFCLDDQCPGMLNTSSNVPGLRSCRVLLLKDIKKEECTDRWSVILPLSWLKPFWITLVSKGAHAIGLKERHWIACDVGLPSFPVDFPDCKAYSCFMANQAAASDKKAELRPPVKRPSKIPIPPPWDCVRISLNRLGNILESSKISTQRSVVNGNSPSISDSESCNIALHCSHGNLFDGIVARTSCVLIDFLTEIRSDHSLLFSKVQTRKLGILNFIKDSESMLDQGRKGIEPNNYGSKLCFIRVLLHAYKEGVFEEGAVICAPFITDISSMTSSESGLQLPTSSIRHYFKELSPTMWELQIPEDPIARESHRWPIGFVTSGFVKGSKKLIAEGFCDAVLLAHIREEQWRAVDVKKRKKEIYVLVRNLRSSAYRLALASIILEQQDEDIQFM